MPALQKPKVSSGLVAPSRARPRPRTSFWRWFSCDRQPTKATTENELDTVKLLAHRSLSFLPRPVKVVQMAPNTSRSEVCVVDERTLAFELELANASVSSSVSTPTPKPREHAVIFFDWDDTLMASTAIAKAGLCPKFINEKPEIPEEIAKELAALEECVVQLLQKALAYGRVVIVTAAETGWVELSATLFMPRVMLLLNTHIKVISARSTYEYLYPDCPRRWKIEAFNHEVFPIWETFDDECSLPRHIISLGDGPTEREALINLKMQAMERCHGKSMKFITYPKIHELRLEVELILANLDHLCTHEGDLDLQITWEMLSGGASE